MKTKNFTSKSLYNILLNWITKGANSVLLGNPSSGSRFDIDDRLECVFVDLDNIRFPVNGIVCLSCGLAQGGDQQNCLYCGTKISTEMH